MRACKIPSLFIAVTLVFSSLPARAEENPFHLSSEADRTILESLDLMYDLRYDEAIEKLKKIQDQAAEHPIIAFSLASALWWRLSVLVLEPDMDESAPFLEAVKRAIDLSQQKISEGDPTGEGHLVMGGVLGLWGRWEATNRNWLSAYFKGKKAIRYLKKTIEINPDMLDAYMGLGIFDYYVATLPAVVRILAFLGSGADKEKGIDELLKAAYHSTYAQIPSKLFLVDIFSNQENNPEKALEILESMKKAQENSPFVHFLTIVTLYNYQHDDELLASANEFLKELEDGVYVESSAPIAYFSAGLAHFKLTDWGAAQDYFTRAVDTHQVKSAFVTWSLLFRGYTHHMLGQKGQAQRDFKSVLTQLRRWNSHENARKALRQPDKSVQDQLEKLQL